MRITHRAVLAAVAAFSLSLSLAACEDDIFVDGYDEAGPPRDVSARYEWVLEGFSGTRAVGHPTVRLEWLPPSDWDEQVFRVYGRRAGGSRFLLLATVTSCTTDGCTYVDRNVAGGERYEYFVSTYDEDTGAERDSDFRETVGVPSGTRPATPRADSVVALDDALYVRWTPQGNAAALWKHQVWLTSVNGQASLYQAGETDGSGYFDERAANGTRYGYRVAAVDTLGHVSDLSAEVAGTPRPDASGELVYALADSAARSGFRFQTSETPDPILDGNSAQAHWRLEAGAGGYRIVPLNGTRVLEFGRTTALACGPGSDGACTAVTRAPQAGYATTAVAVRPEFSYVMAVTGGDGRTHYGVVRATILGSDAGGNALMIFDWAYQNVADEPRLNRLPAR